MINRTASYIQQTGFTLIEVLVAFVILVLALSVLYESFMLGSYGIARAEHQTQALMLAQSALERTGVETPLTLGETVTMPVDGFEVRVRVALLPDMTENPLIGFQPYEVEVRTLWHEGAELRQLRLHSMKLTPFD